MLIKMEIDSDTSYAYTFNFWKPKVLLGAPSFFVSMTIGLDVLVGTVLIFPFSISKSNLPFIADLK